MSTPEEPAFTGELARLLRNVKKHLEARRATYLAGFSALGKRCNALEARIVELEAKLAEVERNSLGYRGVWQSDVEYHKSDCTTHSGSLWVCLDDRVRGCRPGKSSAWRLAVKQGQAA